MQNVLKKIPRWIQLAIVGVIYGATQWWYSTLAGTMKIWRDNQLPGIHSSPIFNEEGVALVVTMLVTGFSVSVLGSFFGPGRLQFRWFCAGVI
ncbi:hypothetical protein KKH81_03735, partial [Patescibacteria group bacterium]|nr:hypothetical protein [Patescibacteria group bacterium]